MTRVHYRFHPMAGYMLTSRLRDASAIASGDRSQPLVVTEEPVQSGAVSPPPFITSDRSPATAVEDRREWNPDRVPSASSSRRWSVPLELARASSPLRVSVGSPGIIRTQRVRSIAPRSWSTLAFKAPWSVQICKRRRARRRFFHASGMAGGKVSKRRRHSEYTDVRC